MAQDYTQASKYDLLLYSLILQQYSGGEKKKGRFVVSWLK
jgi:hypothetical protein